MNLLFKSSLVITVIIMTGCSFAKKATSKGENTAALMNEWKLTELNGNAVDINSTAGLTFSGEKVNAVYGSTGCNRLTGTYSLEGADGLKFGPAATTKMACLDQKVGALENNFLAALQQINKWQVTGNVLSLKNGDKIIAVFKTDDAAQIQKKLNGTWELKYITGPRIAFDGLYPDKKPTISFNLPDTTASGNSSCNGYSATFKMEGHKIHFGKVISTMMACGGSGESVYFETLKKITSFDLTDDSTMVFIMDDIVAMTFKKK